MHRVSLPGYGLGLDVEDDCEVRQDRRRFLTIARS